MTATLSAIALCCLIQAGPKTAVFGFQGIGIDSVTAEVATSIFRSELEATGKYTVATADEIAAVLGADKALSKIVEAQEAARAMGAAKAVLGTLSRLGSQTIGKVQLIDVAGGAVEFQDQLGTTSQDELDIVLKRLAKAVAMKQKASADVELGEVTEKEGREATRRQAFFGGGVGFGGFLPVSDLGSDGVLMSMSGIGFYETPDFFAELRYMWNADLAGTSGATFNPFTIGVFKTASRSDFTPYYGAAVGIGWYSTGLFDTHAGFVVAPGAGYMLFHTYDFHVMADLRYNLMFANGLQHGPSLSVTLAYKRGKGGGGGCCGIGWW